MNTRLERRITRKQKAWAIALSTIGAFGVGGVVASVSVGSGSAATPAPIVVTATGDLGGSVGEITPVADLMKAQSPNRVLLLGDLCYPDGSASCYTNVIEPVYGPLKPITVAAPGNHDSGPGFFTMYPDPLPRGVDIGNGWYVISINTEVSHGAGSAAELKVKQLANDAHAAGKHIIAITHHPRYTGGSGHGDDTSLDAIVADLDAAQADLFLTGHNHIYERFQAMGAGNALRADGQGIRFFTVGTGGKARYSCTSHVGRQVCLDQYYGALTLRLSEGSYAWEFRSTGGGATGTIRDSGATATRTGGVPPSTTTTVAPTTTTTTAAPPAPRLRAAFYYPWFPEAWNQQGIDPYTWFHPSLGRYDNSSAAVIAQHIYEMRYAGLDAGIASWWGQGSRTDGRINALLSGANGTGFKWTLYHEGEGSGNPTVAQITSDLDYITTRYASNPNYLTINGKPVLFVYASGSDGCSMADRWTQANAGRFYLVLKVFSGYRTCASQPNTWHQYAPAKREDSQSGRSYAVSPGFWLRSEATARLARDLPAFDAAVGRMVASNAPLQLVTTYNEWGEGTSIEPASEWGLAYLDVLRNRFTATTPTTTTTVPPTTTTTLACPPVSA